MQEVVSSIGVAKILKPALVFTILLTFGLITLEWKLPGPPLHSGCFVRYFVIGSESDVLNLKHIHSQDFSSDLDN